MRLGYRSAPGRLIHAAAFSLLLCVPALVAAQPCIAPSSGGTVNLPPPSPPCSYTSPTDLHMIINGLPAGTTIKIGVEHERFLNPQTVPGGSFAGGQKETFTSNLKLTMTGTGSLTGFSRVINLPAQCESHTAPRTMVPPNQQSFDTEMYKIQGQLPPGDPDFDLLRITAGSGFGMPSPGHTTLTLRSEGDWNVDSFFDITYKIEFTGHPGSILGGHSGSTTGTIRMATGQPAAPVPGPCQLPANPTGTVDLPPAGCGYVSPQDLHMMIDGLPAGTTVHIAAQHAQFFGVTHGPDGAGGEIENYQAGLTMQLTGTGTLETYHSTKSMQTQCVTHTNARQNGSAIQSFDTEMMSIQGQLPPGDPDFDLLTITAGSMNGLPSPGHTTLTGIPGSEPGAAGGAGSLSAASTGQYNVDSFFDITYKITFHGRPGGPFGGMSGSTTGTIRMEAGHPTLVSVPGNLGTTPSQKIELTNSPNPFSPGTVLQYRLPSAGLVKLTVYDAAGRVVRRLSDEVLPAGPHAMMWDARDDDGRAMGPGTYFVKLSVNGRAIANRKVTIVH